MAEVQQHVAGWRCPVEFLSLSPNISSYDALHRKKYRQLNVQTKMQVKLNVKNVPKFKNSKVILMYFLYQYCKVKMFNYCCFVNFHTLTERSCYRDYIVNYKLTAISFCSFRSGAWWKWNMADLSFSSNVSGSNFVVLILCSSGPMVFLKLRWSDAKCYFT